MRFILLIGIFFCCLSSTAQSNFGKVRPYVEAGAGIPTGIFRYVYTKFIDPRIGVTYMLNHQVKLTANAGYTYFFRKENKTGISFASLSGGVQYALVSKFFLSMEIGGALLMDHPAELFFAVEPGAGWQFDSHHTARVSYYGYVTNGYVIGGINFAYRYTF